MALPELPDGWTWDTIKLWRWTNWGFKLGKALQFRVVLVNDETEEAKG